MNPLRPALAFVLVLVLGSASSTLAAERPAPIPADIYAARRAALLERLGPDARVAILSGSAAEVEHDSDFRVDSDFYYLSGVDEPGAALDLARGRDAILLPKRRPSAERWEGKRLTAESPAAASLGFETVGTLDDRPAQLDDRARRAIAQMRLVKDAHELGRLRRACDITGLALAEAARSIEPGMAEFEVDALVRYVFRREGAERAGYPSIVGSGPNSCVLHYSRNARVMEGGDLVVIDVGAEFGRYTADVTRTFPVSGTFTPEQRRIYEAVLRAQDAGIAAVRPGARVSEVHAAARKVLAEAGLARYFTHGTSHWLGLDVHDVGDYDTPLAPGMVLTVEPGAYIAEKALGVRIEDDILVTADGRENLTAALPRAPDEIERLMAGRGLGNERLRPLPPAPKPAETF